MSILYHISIYTYDFLIRLSVLFNSKARFWVKGRKGLFEKLSKSIEKDAGYVWFHAASLGEFEQGRPVIEAFRKCYPGKKILLTFFSPSGYEIRKNYKGADIVCYMPIDTPGNARRFVELIKPQLTVFIKYEFWFNYLKTLYKKDIPVVFISAIFRKEQHFFRSYNIWFRKQLRHISRFYVQNEQSAELLKTIGITQVEVSGDTRFDRVAAISENPDKFPLIEKFVNGHKVLLAGSSWPADEKLLPAMISDKFPDLKIIIAPHEIDEEHLRTIETLFREKPAKRLSQLKENENPDFRILIIDGIGFLSSLYQYCDVAYIGGGFGKGIHNILEAVAFGKPVIFGPNHTKFNEAMDLIEKKGAFVIHDQEEFIKTTSQLLNEPDTYKFVSSVCRQYIDAKKGATGMIISGISKFLEA